MENKKIKNRGLKNRTAISNAIKTELFEALKQYSEDTQIPMSKCLDNAIEMFLKSTK